MEYLINYTLYDSRNNEIKHGVMKVKRNTEFEAKCSLDNFLQKKHPNSRLVIHSCIKNHHDLFGDIFKRFK